MDVVNFSDLVKYGSSLKSKLVILEKFMRKQNRIFASHTLLLNFGDLDHYFLPEPITLTI